MRRRTLVTTLTALLVPAVAGGIALASFDDRADQVDQVRAAVVNLDEPVTVTDPATGEEQTVPAGRLLAGELTSGGEAVLGWELTDEADAQAGLDDGTYQAAITIPEGFSAAATSVQGQDPEQAVIEVRTAPGGSLLAATVSDQVASAAADSLGGELTSRYLDEVLLGFGDLSTQLGSAAGGAGELASGLGELTDGATAAADGADDLASGTADLASGIDRIASGASTLGDGASSLASGADELAGGAHSLEDGASGLASGLALLREETRSLPEVTRSLADGAGSTAAGADGVADGLAALQAECALAVSPDAVAICVQVDRLVPAAAKVSTGAAQVGAGTDLLADSMPALAAAVDRSATGAEQVAPGAAQVAEGARSLADGGARLSSGTADLADAATAAATGAGALATGTSDLAAGVDDLATGAGEATTGAEELSAGLAEGAQALPAYSDEERAQLVRTVAEPVTSRAGGGTFGSSAVLPLVAVMVLWLGALAIFLLRRPLAVDAVSRATTATRLALQGWGPAAGIAVAQVSALAAVVVGFGIDVASPAAALGVGVLAALAFSSLHQALTATWGRVGAVGSLVLLVLQIASVGGLVPLATAPEVFRLLGGLLPVPLAVDALTALVQGAGTSVTAAVAGLLAWTVGALAVTTWAARRHQRWSVATIRAHLTRGPQLIPAGV